MRRKRGLIVTLMTLVCVYMFIKMEFSSTGYRPLLVLQDAESEARRLLGLMNAKNYECNNTFVVGNRSMAFPLCIDNNSAITLERSDNHGVVYSIGLSGDDDFKFEHTLAFNYTFPVFIITPQKIPSELLDVNNTFYVPARIVPNDFADFSRNSYSQHTINDIIAMLKHTEIDIMKIWAAPSGVQMWELIYYMVRDELLDNVKQLHFTIHIGSIDEDFLYNWYRTLYNLYYEAKFALYHVSASSPLCLQVTMMESCTYYVSYIRDPGAQTFLMHPPADLGSTQLEKQRLLDFIHSKRVSCRKVFEVEQWVDNQLVVTPVPPSWLICIDNFFKQECIVYSFSSNGHQRALERAVKEDLEEEKECYIYHLIPKIVLVDIEHSMPIERIQSLITEDKRELDVLTALSELKEHKHISVVEINLSGYTEWYFLQTMLETGSLANTSQVLIKISLSSPRFGMHPKILRREYSQLKLLEKQGFHLFYSSPCTDSISASKQAKESVECFQLGFTRTDTIYNHPRKLKLLPSLKSDTTVLL